jgi:RNA polymerase sigma factor (sigma-70 family)
MPSADLNTLFRRFTRELAAETLGDQTDRQLVERLLKGGDEPAFEALLRRHGPMVYRVCWRILQHGQDAEDAFQATFLLLARKLATVRKRESLASWLHGVARRAALKARAQTATRRRHERQAANSATAPADDLSARELRTALDTELAALPEKWRLALILCYLEGRTQDEAAAQLGWSKSTMRRRLDEARAALGRRLARRGLDGSAVLCGPLLSDCLPSAHLPPNLAGATVDAGIRTVAGQPVADMVSAEVNALTEGVLRAMFMTKLRPVALVLLVALLGLCGVLVAMPAGPTTGQPQPAAKTAPPGPVATQPDAAPAGKGKILFWQDTRFVFRSPDGKETGELPQHPDKLLMLQPALAPGGKRAAFIVSDNPPTDGDGNLINRHVLVRALDGTDAGTKIDINASNIAWTTDGKHLLVVERLAVKDLKDGGFNTWLVDAKTGDKIALDLPRWVQAFAMMPDGKSLVGVAYDLDARKIHLVLTSRDGKTLTRMTEVRSEGPAPKLSPDGSAILFEDLDPTEKIAKDTPPLHRLFVYDLKAKKRQRLPGTPDNGLIMSYCWSPDGKQLAYTWKQVHPGVPLAENTDNMNDAKLNTETESHLIVADADGKNVRTLLSAKSNRATIITIGSVDWR